jgi:hypothetical protein
MASSSGVTPLSLKRLTSNASPPTFLNQGRDERLRYGDIGSRFFDLFLAVLVAGG